MAKTVTFRLIIDLETGLPEFDMASEDVKDCPLPILANALELAALNFKNMQIANMAALLQKKMQSKIVQANGVQLPNLRR